jgi:hypothetical protein
MPDIKQVLICPIICPGIETPTKASIVSEQTWYHKAFTPIIIIDHTPIAPTVASHFQFLLFN